MKRNRPRRLQMMRSLRLSARVVARQERQATRLATRSQPSHGPHGDCA